MSHLNFHPKCPKYFFRAFFMMLFNLSSDRSIEMKVKGDDGKIALMCACYKGHKDVVEYFCLTKNIAHTNF